MARTPFLVHVVRVPSALIRGGTVFCLTFCRTRTTQSPSSGAFNGCQQQAHVCSTKGRFYSAPVRQCSAFSELRVSGDDYAPPLSPILLLYDMKTPSDLLFCSFTQLGAALTSAPPQGCGPLDGVVNHTRLSAVSAVLVLPERRLDPMRHARADSVSSETAFLEDYVLGVGDTLEMTCDMEDHAEPVVWFKDGAALASSNRTRVGQRILRIINVSYEDSGVYSCRLARSNVLLSNYTIRVTAGTADSAPAAALKYSAEVSDIEKQHQIQHLDVIQPAESGSAETRVGAASLDGGASQNLKLGGFGSSFSSAGLPRKQLALISPTHGAEPENAQDSLSSGDDEDYDEDLEDADFSDSWAKIAAVSSPSNGAGHVNVFWCQKLNLSSIKSGVNRGVEVNVQHLPPRPGGDVGAGGAARGLEPS
ncbi:Fibroblast growth factor receptor 3 [Takifugu flavidus]|uniref:Fibroblast growth factor receptor 3 n=1 Tax=Takifugu flavidus TaxID=433684 RepID=A0A5C6NZJ4_9TELE|nr:Fibroblast growth factor receptor 3 [Takifugu flavidus]